MKYFYYQHIPKFILYQSVCCIFLLSKLPLESSTFNGNDPGYVLQDNIDLEIVLVCALYNSTRIFVSFHFVVIVVGVFFPYQEFRSLVAYTISACRSYLDIFIEKTRNKWEFFILRLKWIDKMRFWVFLCSLSIKWDRLGINFIL